MTQTFKLDISRADQRGRTMGLNEFSGDVGVALACVVTAYMAEALGARLGLLVFVQTVIGAALVLTVVWVRDQHTQVPTALSGWRVGAPHHRRGLRPDELARQAVRSTFASGVGREVRRCAGLGDLPGVPGRQRGPA
jgi:hypothetical protein